MIQHMHVHLDKILKRLRQTMMLCYSLETYKSVLVFTLATGLRENISQTSD